MNFKTMFVATLLVISLAATVAAGNIMENLMDGNRLDKAPEREAVQNAIADGKVIDTLIANSEQFGMEELSRVSGADELTYGEPYKVAMANKELVNALLEGRTLAGTIPTLRYIWEVPVILKSDPENPLCTFTVAFHNNAWRVVEIGGFLSREEISFAGSKNKQLGVLKKNAMDSGTSYVHLRIAAARIDYLYTQSGDQEFFIKINHRRRHDQNIDPVSKEKRKLSRKDVRAEVENRLKQLDKEPLRDGK